MKHAGPAALDGLEPLLGEIRGLGWLKEKSRGVFYLKSRAWLHFHEDPAGLFADIRAPDGRNFDRIRIDATGAERDLMSRLAAARPPSPRPRDA